ncbi:hypothetical protein P781_13650 [Vibrio mimicus CAIM 1883]|nr:hypothetical protein P781_13650 [Vibrio mimicus CAIM 1883]
MSIKIIHTCFFSIHWHEPGFFCTHILFLSDDEEKRQIFRLSFKKFDRW